MFYYLRPGYNQIPGILVPLTQILLIIFLNHLLSQVETKYKPSKLEVIYVVQAVKKLHTIIQNNKQDTIIIIDYLATKGIIKQISLDTLLVNKANY